MEMSAALGAAACREQCIVLHLPLLLRVPHERGGGPPGQHCKMGQHYSVAALHVSFELCLQVDCVAWRGGAGKNTRGSCGGSSQF